MTATDQIRSAVADAIDRGASLLRIATESGVPYATLHAFHRGGNIRSDSMDRLAAYFGMRFTDSDV